MRNEYDDGKKNAAPAAGIKNEKKPSFAALKINKKSIYFMQIYFAIGFDALDDTHRERRIEKSR